MTAHPTSSNRAQQPSHRRWWRYGPLIFWAALIFIGSSELLSGANTSPFLLAPLRRLFPHASEATLGAVHLALRKAGHFTEYAIFAWLAARAFTSSSREFLRRHWFWLALGLVVLYSLSDEFHQSFVPSRGASLYDCLIDSLGGLTMLLWLLVRWRGKAENTAASHPFADTQVEPPPRFRRIIPAAKRTVLNGRKGDIEHNGNS